jgi:peptide/nickel transport system permease protein
MANYIIRRLLLVPVILLGVTILIFSTLQFLGPAERSALYVDDFPKNERVLDGIIKAYGLDQPIYVQYWRWMVGTKNENTGEVTGGILRGDFGYSRTAHEEVTAMIIRRFPATLELALWAVIPIIGGGVVLGIVAAVNHNKLIDQVARVVSIIGWSFPTFVFGLLVLMAFYANNGWFPPGRLSNWASAAVREPSFHTYTKLMTIDSLLNLRFDIFIDALRHLILPILTLSYLSWALLLRVTRSSMLETLRQDYVVTARSKGLAEKDVINKHARPNALIPIATIAGFQVAGLLSGVVITETIFNYPGIGSAAAAAAIQLDVVAVLGFALFNGTVLVITNLIVDILYMFIDPRITLE